MNKEELYPKRTKEELEKIFDDVYSKTFTEEPEIVLWTGKGGVKEFLKVWIENEFQEQYTWRSMRKAYRFLYRIGSIEKQGKLYRLK